MCTRNDALAILLEKKVWPYSSSKGLGYGFFCFYSQEVGKPSDRLNRTAMGVHNAFVSYACNGVWWEKSSMGATLLGCFDVISIYFIIFAPELKHFALWQSIIR